MTTWKGAFGALFHALLAQSAGRGADVGEINKYKRLLRRSRTGGSSDSCKHRHLQALDRSLRLYQSSFPNPLRCHMRGVLSRFSVALALTLPLAAQAFVLGPTAPGKWGPGPMGTGATVTYSYMAGGESCAAEGGGCVISSLASILPVGWQAEVEAAFAAWSAVADITFVEVADDGAAFNAPTASGDIRLGAHAFDGAGGTLAHGYFPPANGSTAAGDIHFDSAELWKVGFGGPGFSIFQVMAHELGHAIGLSHTGVAGSLMNPFYTEDFSGPQADDIAGAVFIYGPAASGVVPEPGSSLSLLLMGLGFAALARRQTRR